MNRIILRFVCYVAVLASVAFWPITEANTWRTTIPTSTFSLEVGPCKGVTCPWGRQCALDENNQAACVCGGGYCYEYYSPVCGSDNKTYFSYCALTKEACRTNSNLTVNYYDRCRNEGSICIGVTCPSNRECAVNENHRTTCVCIQECPTYTYAVCGSDNQTYINDCELRRHSCLTNDNVTLAYSGECKQVATVCNGFSCPKGMKCAVDERHQPVCVCIDECPYTLDIVCGSDGRTYGNECELQREACTSGTNTRVAYKGFCVEGSVCNGYRCPSEKQCTVDQNNRPVCVCVQSCPYDYNPVCGSDGNTYQNLCQLKSRACITGTNITVARTGQCVYHEYCYGVMCTPPKTCVVDADNQTSCGCNTECGNYYYPVCGSDNKTYDSYCHMYADACKRNINVTNYYYGVCSEGSNCQGVYCPDGKHCDSLNQSEPTCVCNTYCSNTYNPVCGSNNKTYNNSCELQRDACLTNTYIYVRSYKRCEEGPGCDYTYCPYGRTCVVDERNQPLCVCSQSCWAGSSKVCGSDDKTYSGECFLNTAACMTNKTITVQRYEQCNKDSPCKGVVCSTDRYCDVRPNGRPICVCNERCESYGSPVCGSDNKTYVNYCQLRKQSCLSTSSILWLYYGKCVEASVCDKVSCTPDKRCAIDERNQPTCVCIDQCLNCQNPVCGSDGQTYGNECELQKQACLFNRNVTLVQRGKCDQGLTCNDISCPSGRICAMNEKNQPTCVCDTKCTYYTYYSPVCGTDGKTYYNDCYLRREACTTDKTIKVDYYGSCRNDASSSSSTTNRRCVGSFCSSALPPLTTPIP